MVYKTETPGEMTGEPGAGLSPRALKGCIAALHLLRQRFSSDDKLAQEKDLCKAGSVSVAVMVRLQGGVGEKSTATSPGPPAAS